MTKKYQLNKGQKIVIIPARMASTRLPGKPMLTAAGKPLVQWTYERAKTTDADHVIVATEDAEITRYCQRVGMIWMLTTGPHPNGTSRVAEVFAKLKPEVQEATSVVVNWQVDEPLIEPFHANILMAQRVASIGTILCSASRDDGEVSENETKVVWSHNRCHWFSRAPMRGAGIHVGIYSFSPFLLKAASLLNTSCLAELESLEQLSWLEAGIRITPVVVDTLPLSINSPDDWEEFKRLKEEKHAAAD